ncbi:sodium:nucleoside cotransporter 2 [Trichuris trichiura]|uniref:Sodium/nucleoside cotransporter n=1 Tax=Trichuris trichiura TaxID=36087 RepID=A0A077ZK41_TRITR|nr:sodium:nucleoside cotransporter 2 [Trichuris trichiura]
MAELRSYKPTNRVETGTVKPMHDQNSIPTSKMEVKSTSTVHRIKEIMLKASSPQSQLCIKQGFWVCLAIAYHAYFIAAVVRNYQRALALIVFTAIGWYLFLYYRVFKAYCSPKINASFAKSICPLIKKLWAKCLTKCIAYLAVAILFTAVVLYCTSHDWKRLNSLAGVLVIVLILLILSNSPTKVNWRPVLTGIGLQFLIGLIVMRWPSGTLAFQWLSDQIVTFLHYSEEGAKFVYGFLVTPPNICGVYPVFIFSVLQAILYFAAVVSLLYHLGVIQAAIVPFAWFMQKLLGTTAAESLNAIAAIFLGISESPLLIKPYLKKLTDSELVAIMCSGFGSVSGSLFAAYVSFGACPAYILSASVMSAPGSLACAKLVMPELQESKLKQVEQMKLQKSEHKNFLEAISNGACDAIMVISQIAANLIVFISILSFLNAVISWLGVMVDIEDLSFEKILGYVFFPIAFLMGVSNAADMGERVAETMVVAELLGTKVVLNEFIAYQKMSRYIQSKQLSPHAQMMATYSLCSFANFGSIGIMLGSIGSICPEKKSVLTQYALKALLAGCATSLLTTSWAGMTLQCPKALSVILWFAGIFVEQPQFCVPSISKGCFNITAV